MNELSTAINRVEGGLKENPPCTPLKENRGNINPSPSLSIAPAHAPAQGTPPDGGRGKGRDCLSNSGRGRGSAQGRRITVNAEFILHGYNAQGLRYDPVQTALVALGIPARTPERNYALIFRWHLRRVGEEAFREIVYEQWRENQIDGAPRNVAAAFTVKLFRAAEGGAQ